MEEFRFPNSSLPFEEFIRYLNGGEYLNTFEVGSVKIPETTWPTVSRISEKKDIAIQQILNRPWINLDKFDDEKLCQTHRKKDLGSLGEKTQQLGFKNPENLEKKQVGNLSKLIEEAKKVKAKAGQKKLSDDDNIEAELRRTLEEMSGSDLPLILDDLDDSYIVHEKKTSSKQTISKKDDSCSDAVKRVSSTASKKKVPSVLSFLDIDAELKLEGSKRKLKKWYDEIENEKKKRRIQVIDYLKPLEITQPPRPKKAPVKKKMTLISRLRRSQLCSG